MKNAIILAVSVLTLTGFFAQAQSNQTAEKKLNCFAVEHSAAFSDDKSEITLFDLPFKQGAGQEINGKLNVKGATTYQFKVKIEVQSPAFPDQAVISYEIYDMNNQTKTNVSSVVTHNNSPMLILAGQLEGGGLKSSRLGCHIPQ